MCEVDASKARVTQSAGRYEANFAVFCCTGAGVLYGLTVGGMTFSTERKQNCIAWRRRREDVDWLGRAGMEQIDCCGRCVTLQVEGRLSIFNFFYVRNWTCETVQTGSTQLRRVGAVGGMVRGADDSGVQIVWEKIFHSRDCAWRAVVWNMGTLHCSMSTRGLFVSTPSARFRTPRWCET